MERTLFVGIGAPKCGTSWLYGYLLRHPQVFMSPVKELHYFDAKYRPDVGVPDHVGKSWDDIFHERVAEMEGAYAVDPKPWRLRHLAALKARVAAIDDPLAYAAYFNEAAGPSHTVMGEISPGYCTLRDDGFQAMRAQSPNVKVLFLLRDPVEHFWSWQRFRQRYREGFDAVSDFHRMLDDFGTLERIRYHATIEALDRVFKPEEVRLEFYECLFTSEAIRGLCDWLNVGFAVPDFAKGVNASPVVELPRHLRNMARDALAPIYDYCQARFGSALPKSWHA